ncbi:MAG: hypothetical protein PHQ23_00215 [Candidatus Wallbacteria bacterium]|nr:hypothetical protein [Candidatus Wallbacteria bacterium]
MDFISEFIQKKKLGQLLVEKGLVQEEQLVQCLQEQAQTKEFLGELLVRKGFINEEVLYKTLAEQLHARFLSFEEAGKVLANVDTRELSQVITPGFLRQHSLFVLSYSGSQIEVLTSDPLNLILRDQIAGVTKREVAYAVCSKTTAQNLLEDSKKKAHDVGAKLIEQAIAAPAAAVERLCERCGDDMIFVLTEIAKKHKDPLARRSAIRRMSAFHAGALVFVFQQLFKIERDPQNKEIIGAFLQKHQKA